jgi:predicted HicB family RNase H-like nuclease
MRKPRTTTAIRFVPEVHEALRETADELGVSINWLVTKLCEEGLERMDLTGWTMTRKASA